MADFREVVDYDALAAFTTAGSERALGTEMAHQTLTNQSGTQSVDVSFDGVAAHTQLAAGASATWNYHKRRRVWLMKVGAATGAAHNVEIRAWNE